VPDDRWWGLGGRGGGLGEDGALVSLHVVVAAGGMGAAGGLESAVATAAPSAGAGRAGLGAVVIGVVIAAAARPEGVAGAKGESRVLIGVVEGGWDGIAESAPEVKGVPAVGVATLQAAHGTERGRHVVVAGVSCRQ
jgi:hypothetical protein